MKKKIIIVILMLMLGIVAGCIGLERVYISGEDKIILSGGDYQWYDNRNGYVFIGKYQETPESILFILDPPFPSIEMKKTDNGSLTYKTDVWVLQR